MWFNISSVLLLHEWQAALYVEGFLCRQPSVSWNVVCLVQCKTQQMQMLWDEQRNKACSLFCCWCSLGASLDPQCNCRHHCIPCICRGKAAPAPDLLCLEKPSAPLPCRVPVVSRLGPGKGPFGPQLLQLCSWWVSEHPASNLGCLFVVQTLHLWVPTDW